MHRFHCRQTPLSGTGAAGAHGAQRGSVRVGQTPGIHSRRFLGPLWPEASCLASPSLLLQGLEIKA